MNPPDYKIDGIIANAQSISVDSANYSIEAALEKSESYIVRNDDGGYKVEISADGTKVTLRNVKTKQIIAESDISSNNTSHKVKTTLFDEQIRIFVDKNPQPVIRIYEKSGFTGNITVNAGAENVVISKESYEIEAK